MKAVRHTGIVVKDLKKSLHFYRDVLGLKVKTEKREKGEFIDKLLSLDNVNVKIVKLSARDGNLVELLHYGSHRSNSTARCVYDTGYSHIAFTVDNIDHEYKRLKKEGIRFNSAPLSFPHGKAKVAYCKDPEGNFIELVEEIA
jgi:lactoylglutathione lyase